MQPKKNDPEELVVSLEPAFKIEESHKEGDVTVIDKLKLESVSLCLVPRSWKELKHGRP